MKLKKKNLNVNDVEKKLNIHLIDCVKNVHRFNYIIKYMKLEWNKFVLLGLLTKLFKKHKLSKQFVILVSTKETREMKSRQQEKTYYKIFDWIGKYLWYDKEIVKQNILKALFWTYEVKMFWEIHLVANISRTRDLKKDQARLLIDWSLEYAKKIGAWIDITPKEVKSLYDRIDSLYK